MITHISHICNNGKILQGAIENTGRWAKINLYRYSKVGSMILKDLDGISKIGNTTLTGFYRPSKVEGTTLTNFYYPFKIRVMILRGFYHISKIGRWGLKKFKSSMRGSRRMTKHSVNDRDCFARLAMTMTKPLLRSRLFAGESILSFYRLLRSYLTRNDDLILGFPPQLIKTI